MEPFIIRKKLVQGFAKKIKSVFSELFFTCGTKIQELDCNKYLMLYMWDNLTCISPIKSLYCSAMHPCCFHCGTKCRLIIEKNHYLICSICKNLHKKQAVMKRKRKFVSAWTDQLIFSSSLYFSASWSFVNIFCWHSPAFLKAITVDFNFQSKYCISWTLLWMKKIQSAGFLF